MHLRSENFRYEFSKSLVKATTLVKVLYEVILDIYLLLLFKANNLFF